MPKSSFPLSEVYGLLEPGPVILLTTALNGRTNVMAQSWLTMLEFEPPLVGCVVSNRNHSFQALDETGECVINIPTVNISAAVVGCGNTSGRDTDKFAMFGLTPQPATCVRPPQIRECFASLECRVVDTTLVARYGFFVLEVLSAWMDAAMKTDPTLHHCGRGVFMLAGKHITLPSKMK